MQFLLSDIPLELYIGIENHEKSTIQTVYITVQFSFDASRSAISDNIKDTINYADIEKIIREKFHHTTINLIEKLHGDLYSSIIKKFPLITDLNVRLKKFPFEHEGNICISNT